QFNGKWVHELGNDGRLSFVLNILDQPLSKDPLGLTLTDFETNPRQVTPIAISMDSRKSVAQQQAGVVLEQRLGAATLLTARLYVGARQLDNALGLPLSAQTADTSSGGIVKLERQYGGLGVQLAHSIKLDSGQTLRLTGGVDLDRLNEDRQGFINSGGVAGARKRDESNSVQNQDFFAQAAFDLSSQWTATAGLRSSRVKFNNIDHFIVPPRTTSPTAPGNPDDSGGVDYSATNPVLGLAWRAAPELNLYANIGQGFETPTFAELSYRPSPATGLNTALRASRSRHAEVGAKWKLSPTQRIDAALFDISTEDEIVVDVNTGGRSTFKNAGHTKRSGLELQYAGQFGADWRVAAS
ncbi:TonB-dependent receptor domain-containing protein, partial [Roseateles sp. GG27B]